MRSKYDPETGKYEGNSYNVGDFINVMDYSLKIRNYQICEKFAELIAFRKNNEAFRLASRDDINARLSEVSFENGNISFTVDDYLVVHSLPGGKVSLDQDYELVYSNYGADPGVIPAGTFYLGPNDSVVLRKVR